MIGTAEVSAPGGRQPLQDGEALTDGVVLWDGKRPPGVLFPQFPTALTSVRNGRDKPDLHLRRGIAIILPPRPAFVGGKGSPCEKEKGSLCEEES
jgi:hypothetical protein